MAVNRRLDQRPAGHARTGTSPPLSTPRRHLQWHGEHHQSPPPDTNATVYYTLDGSLPTTNSFLYSGPFVLTSTAIVSANAFEATFNNSVATNNVFVIVPCIVSSSLPARSAMAGSKSSCPAQPIRITSCRPPPISCSGFPSPPTCLSRVRFILPDPDATNFPYPLLSRHHAHEPV